MKILILNYEFPPLGGGASPVSYEIAKGYAELGHKVSVITMGYKGLLENETIRLCFGDKKKKERSLGHPVKSELKIYRMKCLRSKKEICHPWEQLTYIISAKKFLRDLFQKPFV